MGKVKEGRYYTHNYKVPQSREECPPEDVFYIEGRIFYPRTRTIYPVVKYGIFLHCNTCSRHDTTFVMAKSFDKINVGCKECRRSTVVEIPFWIRGTWRDPEQGLRGYIF